MFVCCECCVLSGRGLCDELITCPEESYRLWRVVVCDLETSRIRRLKPATGLWKIQQKWVITTRKQTNKQTYIACHVNNCTAVDAAAGPNKAGSALVLVFFLRYYDSAS